MASTNTTTVQVYNELTLTVTVVGETNAVTLLL